MANVKPVVLKSNGDKSELSSVDTLTIPTISANPIVSPPTGYVYLYALASDNNFYQMNSSGVIINLASSGGGSGLNFQEIIRLKVILNNI
jgi:hypothetical protein